MSLFDKIIELSKSLAASLLRDEKPDVLHNSDMFKEGDKDYILKNLTDDSLIKERLTQADQINNETDWKKVKSKIDIPHKVYFWRYAAAAMIAALLTTTYFFKYTGDNVTDKLPITSGINNLEPGSSRATLQLEDGSVIVLEKGKTYKNHNTNSNGEELIFNSSKISKKEIVYNYLTIPTGGQFYIKLSDGSQVWLNSESKLKIPVNFVDGETREVVLIYGEAYFDVSPSENHKGSKFVVRNQSQQIEVLGTEFNVKAYKNEKQIYTTLIEGKVAIDNGVSKQNLAPNEQAVLDIDSNSIKVAEVDVASEVSWRQGVFSFRDKPLRDIIKVMSRWYNIDIIIENKELENVKFKGVFRKDENLEALLSIIKNLSIINNYEINDKQIILK
jgi:hypothetical protein